MIKILEESWRHVNICVANVSATCADTLSLLVLSRPTSSNWTWTRFRIKFLTRLYVCALEVQAIQSLRSSLPIPPPLLPDFSHIQQSGNSLRNDDDTFACPPLLPLRLLEMEMVDDDVDDVNCCAEIVVLSDGWTDGRSNELTNWASEWLNMNLFNVFLPLLAYKPPLYNEGVCVFENERERASVYK